MGNAHPKYLKQLKLVRPTVERCYEQIASFRFEVDQRSAAIRDKGELLDILTKCHDELQKILGDSSIDIPTAQRDDIRNNMTEIYILQRAVEDYPIGVKPYRTFDPFQNSSLPYHADAPETRSLNQLELIESHDDDIPMMDAPPLPPPLAEGGDDEKDALLSTKKLSYPVMSRSAGGLMERGINSNNNNSENHWNGHNNSTSLMVDRDSASAIRPMPKAPASVYDDRPNRFITPEMQRILLNRLQSTLDNLREFLRWMDDKLERKWWLKETIRILRTLLLLATFISASAGVMYSEKYVPYVTLSFTISSGVLDIIDQIFIKGTDPEKFKGVGGLKKTRAYAV